MASFTVFEDAGSEIAAKNSGAAQRLLRERLDRAKGTTSAVASKENANMGMVNEHTTINGHGTARSGGDLSQMYQCSEQLAHERAVRAEWDDVAAHLDRWIEYLKWAQRSDEMTPDEVRFITAWHLPTANLIASSMLPRRWETYSSGVRVCFRAPIAGNCARRANICEYG